MPSKKKFYVILILMLSLVFTTKAFASLTFTTDAITGTTASSIDLGAGNALNLQTTGNGAINLGSGLLTSTGSAVFGNNITNRFELWNHANTGDGIEDAQLQVLYKSTRVDDHVHDTHVGIINDYMIYPTADINTTPDVQGIYSMTGLYGPYASHGTISAIMALPYVQGPGGGVTANFGYTGSYGELTGVNSSPLIADALVDKVRAFYSDPYVAGYSTATIVDTVIGLDTKIDIDSGATVNEWYNILADVKNYSGTINKLYGLYIGPHIEGVTESYNIYSTGATSKNYFEGSVGIGTNTLGASSILDISSTTKGVVLPRMTQAQRNAIATPVAGMAIYQTDAVPGLRVYNGTNWMRFTETAD